MFPPLLTRLVYGFVFEVQSNKRTTLEGQPYREQPTEQWNPVLL